MIGGDFYSPGDLPGEPEPDLCDAFEAARLGSDAAWNRCIERLAELQERLAEAEHEIQETKTVLRRTLSAIHTMTPVPKEQ